MAAKPFEPDWEDWRERQRQTLMRFGLGPAEAAIEAERAERRARARGEWVRAQMAAWREAMERCDAAWMKLVEEHPDEDDLDAPPEQAEVDRLYGEIRAVADRDRWPRHLYWGSI